MPRDKNGRFHGLSEIESAIQEADRDYLIKRVNRIKRARRAQRRNRITLRLADAWWAVAGRVEPKTVLRWVLSGGALVVLAVLMVLLRALILIRG